MARAPRRTPGERRQERAAVEDTEVVLAAAARFLQVRQRSTDEVRRRLLDAGYRPSLVDEVLARLEQLGYLDDAAFARAWVESRDRARPRGQRALRLELVRKGVAQELIDEVLREREAGADHADHGDPASGWSGVGADPSGDDEDADQAREPADVVAARRLLDRRGAALARVSDPRRRRQRAYALLARNGFDPNTIRTALDAADPDGQGNEDDGAPTAENRW